MEELVYSAVIDSASSEDADFLTSIAVSDSTIIPPFSHFSIYMAFPLYDLQAYEDEYNTFRSEYRIQAIRGLAMQGYDSSIQKNLHFSNIFITHDEQYALVYVEVLGDSGLTGSGRFVLLHGGPSWRIVWTKYIWKG